MFLNFIYIYLLFYSCAWFIYLNGSHNDIFYMYFNGGRYQIKKLDETKKTSNSGIFVVFEVTNVSSRTDRHPEISEN